MELTVEKKKEVNKKIIDMIVPITLENILQVAVGLVSMGLIGHIGALPVSAVGIGGRITNLIFAFFKGIAVATTVFVARYYGAGEKGKLKLMIQQSLLSIIVLSIMVAGVVLVFTPQLLTFFNAEYELISMAIEYLKIAILGIPFFMVLLTVNAAFQGMGNTKTPLILSIIMNIVNLVLGYILIFGIFGEPMGVRGAAIAGSVAQGITCAIGLYLMLSDERYLKEYCNLSFFKFQPNKMIKLYKVGVPSAMEMVFWQIATIILTRAILTYGATAYAAHQLGLQAESISFMPAQGFGIAATALIGQGLGAGDIKLAKYYFKTISKWGFIVAILGAGILIVFPSQLMALLTNDHEIIKLGAVYLMLMGLTQCPQNMEKIMTGAMRGAGYTKIPMYVAAFGLWGIRLPLSLISTYIMKWNIYAIWIIIDIDIVIRFLISIYLYRRINIYKDSKL